MPASQVTNRCQIKLIRHSLNQAG